MELWRLDKAQSIPQRAGDFLLNVWHTPTHWLAGGGADYPAANAVMLVDRISIWQ